MNTPILRRATVFVSSTFSDMTSERDLMMYSVFPKVKKWAFERGIIFDIVDLRWGINDNQAKDLHQTIQICLKKVQESDPLFLCFVGERYGWIPEKPYFNQEMFQRDIQKYIGLSATELEIAQALDAAFYESSPKSCLFLLRDPLDLIGVPEKIKEIYIEEHAKKEVDRLRTELMKIPSTIRYHAEFSTQDSSHALCNLTSNGSPLEELLCEQLKAMLTAQYQLKDNAPMIHEDVLVRQQYHLRQISILPRIESCHEQIREYLAQTGELTHSYIGITRDSSLKSQVAQFIAESPKEELKIIYRFMGIDPRLETVLDLLTSLAYELSGNADYLNDAIGALYFIKEELERTSERILLVIVGLPSQFFDECMSVLQGLKFYKSLIFVEVDDPKKMRYHLIHSESSFAELAKYLFEKHAKALTKTQMERVLMFVHGDDALLQTIVNYLCTFATHDTLDQILTDLVGFDKKAVVHRYIEQIISIQNRHQPAGVMEKTLELLCHTPLPITEEDIVEVICRCPSVCGEHVACETIRKEVSFSLAFAHDFIVEYNGRFKIYNKTIIDYFLFTELPDVPAPYHLIPKESTLTQILQTDYFNRLWSMDKSFGEADAQNFVEIIKDYSTPDFRNRFYHIVIKDERVFYKLAKALRTRGLVDLMKTLSMQSLDADVDSYFAREMRRVFQIEDNSLGFSQDITREKIFSVSRKNHPDNPFLHYYGVSLTINERDLLSFNDFAKLLKNHAFENAQDASYYALRLPECLNITPHNITAFTVFDVQERSYKAYFCHCDKGMIIICDALTGELKRAYAIPYCGKIISMFYQEKTVHIVSDQGILITINLLSGHMEIHRFIMTGNCVGAFSHNYSNGYQFATVNENKIEIYYAIVKKGSICFKEGWAVQSVYGLSTNNTPPKQLIIIVKDPAGLFSCLLFDLVQNKITFSHNFADNQITESIQNDKTGVVYLRTDRDFTIILKPNNGNDLDIDVDGDRYCYASYDTAIRENENGVFCNDQLITEHGKALCGFSSRNFVGFVTDEKILYIIDNGY